MQFRAQAASCLKQAGKLVFGQVIVFRYGFSAKIQARVERESLYLLSFLRARGFPTENSLGAHLRKVQVGRFGQGAWASRPCDGADECSQERRKMVATQLVDRGISNARVLAAMENVPPSRIPVGGCGGAQQLYLLKKINGKKINGKIQQRSVTPARFIPMVHGKS